MKKILISLLSFLLLTSVAWANYFDNYPKRFVSYDSTSRFKAYIDMDSVNVVRYDPPYYEIQATTYYFDYVLHGGRVCQEFCVNRFNKQHRIAA